MGSNRGNNPKHAPGYTCYKEGNPAKKQRDKKVKTKQITKGKQRAQELAARQAALAAR